MVEKRPMGKFFEPEWPDGQHNHDFVYEEGQPESVIGGMWGWKVCTRCGGRLLIRSLLDKSTGTFNGYIRNRQPEDLDMMICLDSN